MFFIFGSPRSGTTLLAQCLNAHSALVVPHETDFIVPMAFVCDRIRDIGERRGILKQLIPRSAAFARSLGEFASVCEIEAIVDKNAEHPAILLNEIYALVATKADKKQGGDKSPNDLLFLRMLVKTGTIGPDAKIIHIIRDGRDVLSSIIAAQLTDQPEVWFPGLWSASNIYLRDVFGLSRQYHLVRYEEFVSDPQTALGKICQHLGVSFECSMIDPAVRSPRYMDYPHHTKLFEPISPRNIGNYRKTLTQAGLAQCERQAEMALKTFGYMPAG